MITQAELARLAGVKRQAITYQLDKGRLNVNSDGTFDPEDPLVKDYINKQTLQRRNKAPRPSSPKASKGTFEPKKVIEDDICDTIDELNDDEGADDYNTWELRKLRASAKKLEIENDVKLRKYVPRDSIMLVFGKIASVHSSRILSLGSKLSDELAAELGVTDASKVLRVQHKVDEEMYSTVEQIKRELDDYLLKLERT